MDKRTLLKYFNGELNPEQKQAVLDWVNSSRVNEQYFIKLMNLWATQTVSNDKASEDEYNQMLKLVQQKEDLSGNNIFKKLFWAAAAVIVLLIASNIFLLSIKKEITGIQKEISSVLLPPKNFESYKELYTNKGVKASLLLPDSSIVFLNSDTKIIYPDRFDSLTRNVKIEGEAYFKVVKDTLRPMIVTTGKGFAVRVWGTEFNLRANENDTEAQATLYNGKIDIIREKNGKVLITPVQPNETITVGKDNICTKVILNEPEKLMAWRDGKLIFDNTPLSEAAKMLERWYGVEVVVADKSILDFRFTSTFEQESIVQVMELLKIIAYIDYTIEGKRITLTRR